MSLLNEAIIDAKNLQNLAIANAKTAIEETFQPTIQRLVSSKIAEEEGEEEELEMPEDDFDTPAVGFGDTEEEDEFASEEELDFSDEELDEINEYLGESDDVEFEDEEELTEEELEFSDEELDEIFEEEEFDVEKDDEDFSDEELDEINEYLGESDDMEFEDEEDIAPVAENKMIKRKLRRTEEKLREALQANMTLKRAINEVNLLNAKLMYTTKIVGEFELDQKQKMKVLEAFDRANTVQEVKSKFLDMKSLLNGRKTAAKSKVTEVAGASRPVAQTKKQQLDEGIVRAQVLAGLRKAYE